MDLTLLNGRYKLNADRAIYSYEDKYHSFAQAFKRFQVPIQADQSVLILGYGLGSIPKLLVDHYASQAKMIGVELDPAVIDLNAEYGFQSDQVQLIQGDASKFIENTSEKYDLICHDVFIDYIVPENCFDLDYLNKMKACLKPNGVFLFSLMSFNKKQKEQNNLYFQNQFLPIFPNAKGWDLSGNAMIYFKAN